MPLPTVLFHLDIFQKPMYNVFMAQNYDNMAKNLLSEYATEISQFVLGVNDVEVLENIDTEQQIVIGQRTDSTKRIRVNNREVILHIELQLRDSIRKPMWARNATYHGYLLGEHQIPVYSNVIYLHPTAGRNDTGVYEYSWDGYEYSLRYKVIRLIEIDGRAVLDMKTPGILPFTPLMKPPAGMNVEQWVQECVEVTTAASVDQQTRGDLLCAISLFGSIVYDAQLFKRLIQAELMQESKYYQLLREEFMAEGARETTIKHIIVLLKTKFTADAVSALTPNIQKINDLQRLEQLHLAAAQAKSLEAFKQIIQE